MFSYASFFGVVAVSVDRFLAIRLHLRYQELVTHKRVVAVVNSQSGCLGSRAIFCYLSSFLLEAFVFSFQQWLSWNLFSRTASQESDSGRKQVQDIAESGEMANFASLLNLR